MVRGWLTMVVGGVVNYSPIPETEWTKEDDAADFIDIGKAT